MMDPILIPVHAQVPGRVRFRIVSAHSLRELADSVFPEFRRLPGIHRITMNKVTGSFLVFFDPEDGWPAIAVQIGEMIEKVSSTGAPSKAVFPAGALPSIGSGEEHQWYHLDRDQALEAAGTSPITGLDPGTAEYRIRVGGRNLLASSAPRGRLAVLKDQFGALPMVFLLAESVAALWGGAILEAALLTAIVSVNAVVGYFIDRRAELAIVYYKSQTRPPVRVLRDGRWIEVAGDTLTVGDILELMPGTFVGADSRIIEASHLKIDESILTGESRPVEKTSERLPGRRLPLFDQRNMAFMGTLVVGGKGIAVVAATGLGTQFGKLHRLFDETVPPETPIVAKIRDLSTTLLNFALTVGVGVSVVGLLRGGSLGAATAQAVSILAMAIPAGLPSAATVNMAVGIRRLKRENVSIRRLYSLESLSAVRMICFDKTGTLTQSRIKVQRIFCSGKEIRLRGHGFWEGEEVFLPLQNADFRRLMEACVLCSEARFEDDGKNGRRKMAGSPTEMALLGMAVAAGVDIEGRHRIHPLQKVRHRGDTERSMATVHTAPMGATLILVKGDPNEVLEMCGWRLKGGKRVRLSPESIGDIEIQNQSMAGAALRVLGFAYRHFKKAPEDPAVEDLTWIGLVGMAEPIREGVTPLISRLHEAGIQTVMITGDQSVTADAVAREIGLYGEAAPIIFDSSRFDSMSPDLLSALTQDVRVFARVNPSQKLQIVQSYQRSGMVVAMTGDGINDGPALRAADVGIAMGQSGTDAAREVADMVLERDNLASVETAVREGRASYRNLKRALRFFISTHLSDMVLMTLGSVSAYGVPLRIHRPVQAGLLTDLAPGLSLLAEPASLDIGQEPPRDPKEPILSKREMMELTAESLVLTGSALAAYGYGIVRYGFGPVAATLAHETLSAAKVLHGLTCRPWPRTGTKAEPPSNPILSISITAALMAQLTAIFVPGLRRMFRIAPLRSSDLWIAGSAASASLFINRYIRGKRLRAQEQETTER